MVDPFTGSHMGQLGFFPLSSYSRAKGLFQAYKNLFLSMYLLSTYLLVLQFCSKAYGLSKYKEQQPRNNHQHKGTKKLKMFGILLQWLPSSTLTLGIISEEIGAGVWADLPNYKNLCKANTYPLRDTWSRQVCATESSRSISWPQKSHCKNLYGHILSVLESFLLQPHILPLLCTSHPSVHWSYDWSLPLHRRVSLLCVVG